MESIKKPASARSKRQFSIETKKDFCIKWRASGLGKREFCRIHNISVTTFYKWCQKFLACINTENESSCWAPVIPIQERLPREESGETVIELSLPNQMTIRIKVSMFRVVSLVQELSHAITVIR